MTNNVALASVYVESAYSPVTLWGLQSENVDWRPQISSSGLCVSVNGDVCV